MAIEDEIINISDLDLGTEILRNDKLIIETNNGTKLIDFKDFVIGVDNISFYHLISGRGDNVGLTSTKIVGGYQLLSDGTDIDHKPTYGDLRGSIELGASHENAISEFKSLSSIISQNNGDIQNILARLSQITALLEQPQEISLKTGGKLRLRKIRSYADSSNSAVRGDGEWYDNLAADLEVVDTGTDSDLVTIPARLSDTTTSPVNSVNFKVTVTGSPIAIAANGNLPFNRQAIIPAIGTLQNNPFKMTYPASSSDFITTTIQYSGYIEIEGASASTRVELFKDGNLIRPVNGAKLPNNCYAYEFNHVEEVTNSDIVVIRVNTGIGSGTPSLKIKTGSSFAGVRII